MEREESVLARISLDERRLIYNYRCVNAVRQDTLLYFSDELVKLEIEEKQPAPDNVVHLRK